jgi:hypothetical protein
MGVVCTWCGMDGMERDDVTKRWLRGPSVATKGDSAEVYRVAMEIAFHRGGASS